MFYHLILPVLCGDSARVSHGRPLHDFKPTTPHFRVSWKSPYNGPKGDLPGSTHTFCQSDYSDKAVESIDVTTTDERGVWSETDLTFACRNTKTAGEGTRYAPLPVNEEDKACCLTYACPGNTFSKIEWRVNSWGGFSAVGFCTTNRPSDDEKTPKEFTIDQSALVEDTFTPFVYSQIPDFHRGVAQVQQNVESWAAQLGRAFTRLGEGSSTCVDVPVPKLKHE